MLFVCYSFSCPPAFSMCFFARMLISCSLISLFISFSSRSECVLFAFHLGSIYYSIYGIIYNSVIENFISRFKKMDVFKALTFKSQGRCDVFNHDNI